MPVFNKFTVNQSLLERFQDIRNELDRPYEPKVYEKAVQSTVMPSNPTKGYEEWRRTLGKELDKIPNREIVEVVEVK